MATEVLEARREGSRWVDGRPTGEEVAEWFATSVPMHDGMIPERYVGGVTLIPAKERSQVMLRNTDTGATELREVERLVHTPYMKVETRVAYFWELCADRGWVGVIEPVLVTALKDPGHFNLDLPPGFFRFPVQRADGKIVHQVGCSMQVRVYEPQLRSGGHGRLIMSPPAGTKIVNTLTKWGEDPYALMKAETGAVGRALGMAGMLVIPGSGVATAEDMLEARGGGSDEAKLPPPAAPSAEETAQEAGDLNARAAHLIGKLQSEFPEQHELFTEWAKGRKINLSAIDAQQLRGVVKKLERTLEDANGQVA